MQVHDKSGGMIGSSFVLFGADDAIAPQSNFSAAFGSRALILTCISGG